MHLIVAKLTLVPAGHHGAQVVSIRLQHSPCSCQVVILCVDIHGVLVHMAACDRIKSVRDSEEVKYIIHLCQKGLLMKRQLEIQLSCVLQTFLQSDLSVLSATTLLNLSGCIHLQ